MDKNKKILIGVVAGVVLLCAVIGITGASFRAGMMMSGRGNYTAFGSRNAQQAVRPAAPQEDVPAAPAAPVAPQAGRQKNAGRGFDQNNNNYDNNNDNNRNDNFGSRSNNGRGWSPFGFIGGIFRFIGTLALIGLIFFFIRMMFFKRGWGGPWSWGGPGRRGWGGPGSERGVPSHFEEWHKRAHEPQAAPQSDAPKPADADAPATEAKPDDNPQDPQAI